jgi:hypothetical protein
MFDLEVKWETVDTPENLNINGNRSDGRSNHYFRRQRSIESVGPLRNFELLWIKTVLRDLIGAGLMRGWRSRRLLRIW